MVLVLGSHTFVSYNHFTLQQQSENWLVRKAIHQPDNNNSPLQHMCGFILKCKSVLQTVCTPVNVYLKLFTFLKWNSQTELCSQKHRLLSLYKDTSIHAMTFNILNSLSVFNSLWEVQTVYFHVCLLPWLIDYFLFPLQWHMQVNAANQKEPTLAVPSSIRTFFWLLSHWILLSFLSLCLFAALSLKKFLWRSPQLSSQPSFNINR